MTVESFIEAMPKVELHIHLEGGASKETLLIIADQNEIIEKLKHFGSWVALLDKPDYERLDDLIRVTSQWVKFPEDLTRMVYDLGTQLARQNVKYAEVTVNPGLYAELGLTMEQLVAALNDGRDRAQRAWGIQMGWIIAIPRDEPRKADDYARWASSIVARRSGVVGLGLSGKETVQPVGQFERAFKSVEKKGVARVPHAGEIQGASAVEKAIDLLLPSRIADAWGIWESPTALQAARDQRIGLDLSMARALRTGKIASYADYPLRRLYDDAQFITLGSDMPTFYKSTLNQQYTAAVKEAGLSIEELQEVALNAVRSAVLSDEDRATMIDSFTEAYQALHAEHVAVS